MSGIADPRRLRGVTNIFVDDANEIGADGRFRQQRDAESGADEVPKTAARHIMKQDSWSIYGRSQLRDDQILKFWTWISSAQKDSLRFEVGPVDELLVGERMIFREAQP